MVGETASKFLSLGSSNKNVSPLTTFNLNGGAVSDIAMSPDGTRMAAACRDGVLRILDVANGSVVAGMQSYFGAMLCCSFSGDGKYVAAGAEDDMVVVYGMQVGGGGGGGGGAVGP